jgi:hypothetical protein
MKKLLVILLMLVLCSCESIPVDYSRSQSWLMEEKLFLGTLAIKGVRVDRSGGWDSVEREIASLAPLYFWALGFRVVFGSETADYTAEIQAREREYSSGWRTKRSLLLEVRIWDESAAYSGETEKMPLAAGRVVAVGERSFSSSDTSGRMLLRAIKKAVRKIPAQKG